MKNLHQKIELLFSGFASFVYRCKYITLIMMLILTCGLASRIPTLVIDTRDESFFHDDDPILVEYNKFRDIFGQDDMFIVALKPEAGFSREFFSTLYQIHTELAAHVPYLDDITSLVNARVTRSDGDTLIVEELMEKPPKTPEVWGLFASGSRSVCFNNAR